MQVKLQIALSSVAIHLRTLGVLAKNAGFAPSLNDDFPEAFSIAETISQNKGLSLEFCEPSSHPFPTDP